MQIHFQQRPWDLYLVVAYTLVLTCTFLAFGVSEFAAMLLILFSPGYVLVGIFFPGDQEITWARRVALSLGLGLAIVPLLGFLLNSTPSTRGFAVLAETVALFTVVAGGLAWLRRTHLPSGRRLSLTIHTEISFWGDYTLIDKATTLLLLAIIVMAIGAFAYGETRIMPSERFTEFYLLGPQGNANDYPTRLNVSQNGTVIIGVVNHEYMTVNYTVRVDLIGLMLIRNATSGLNATVDVNRTTLDWFHVTLGNEQNWIRPYSFLIASAGFWKIQFLLFRNDSLVTPYSTLQLFVSVLKR